MVNQLLSDGFDTVRWLESDTAQGEFTAPGVVALHDVDKPLLGNALSHRRQRSWHHAYFHGEVDPGRETVALQEQLHALCAAHYARADRVPLVINTCGWTTGVGLDVLQALSSALRGARVALVHLDRPARLARRRAMGDNDWLTENLVGAAVHVDGGVQCFTLPGGTGRPHGNRGVVGDCTAAIASSLACAHACRQPSASVRRTYRIAWHICGGDGDQRDALLRVPTYAVPFHSVRLAVRHVPPTEALVALNGALVALCADSQAYAARDDSAKRFPLALLGCTPWLAPCAALGIVRAVDVAAQRIHVSTGLPLDLLAHVNTLVLGAEHIPVALLVGAAHANASLHQAPYVVHEALGAQSIGAATFEKQRNHLPRRKHT